MRLPPLPRSVLTALGPVEVQEVAIVPGEDGISPTHDLGYANYHARVILIRAGMAPVAQWHTLYHEQAHFMLFDGGVKLSDDMEETICDVVASLRVRELLESLTAPR